MAMFQKYEVFFLRNRKLFKILYGKDRISKNLHIEQ